MRHQTGLTSSLSNLRPQICDFISCPFLSYYHGTGHITLMSIVKLLYLCLASKQPSYGKFETFLRPISSYAPRPGKKNLFKSLHMQFLDFKPL